MVHLPVNVFSRNQYVSISKVLLAHAHDPRMKIISEIVPAAKTNIGHTHTIAFERVIIARRIHNNNKSFVAAKYSDFISLVYKS